MTRPGPSNSTFSGAGLTAGPFTSLVVTPAAASQLVIYIQPSATAIAGQSLATQPVIYEEDPYGNLETGDDSTVVQVTLAGGTGALQGSPKATVSGGIATFTNLADETAQTVSLSFSSGGLAGAISSPLVVSPAAASQLVIHTQPASTETAGQAFTVQPVVYEEDQFGNLETGDNSTLITATLASGTGSLQGTTSVTVKGGVAAFTGLAASGTATVTLEFISRSLTPASSNPINVTSASTPASPTSTPTSTPAPTIIGESVVVSQKKNKKGKPHGKAVLEGFALDYSTAMNPSTAGLSANYQVDSFVTKRFKRKTTTVPKPVNFTVAYNPSNDSVNLTIEGKPNFAKGGRIQINVATTNGVASDAGVLLDAIDADLTILAKARGITPG